MLAPTSDFITLAGETVALLLAPPNFSAGNVTVELSIDGRKTTALSGRQTRANFHRFARYSIEYPLDTMAYEDPAKSSTELRLWLTRLKGETVAVPLWMDGIVFSQAVHPGQTLIPIEAGDFPVRYGNQWVIMNEASDSYEVVMLFSLTSSVFRLFSGTHFAWPAGTIAYPLLFGRLTARPQFKADTDELLSGTIKVQENSIFDRRISPLAGSIPVIGPRIIDRAAYKLWTIYPDYASVLDATEADILYAQLGFIRQDQQQVYQQPPRRVLEYGYALSGRAEIAAIERFFVDRAGTTKEFFKPTFRGDMRLFSDLPAPSDPKLIPIEPDRYGDPDYAQYTEGLNIAIVDAVDRNTIDIEAHEVLTIDLDGLHVAFNVNAHLKDTTMISHLVLGCFGEPKITWSYDADGSASTTIKVVEQTSEYVTPNPELVEKAYLFTITQKIPGFDLVSQFTSYEAPIVWTGVGTFNPGPFSFDKITGDLQLGDKTTVSTFDFVGNPFNDLLGSTAEGRFEVVIQEVSVDNPADGSALEIFRGEVSGADFTGQEWKIDCQFAADLDEEFGFFIQQICNVPVFSPKCSLLRSNFQGNGTIESIAGLTIVITGDASLNKADHYYAIGELWTGVAAAFESRDISESVHTVVAGVDKQTLTLKKPLFKAIVGQSVKLYPGCDGSIATCIDVFNNAINHRGHPYVPITNPSANTAQVQTSSGGKKG